MGKWLPWVHLETIGNSYYDGLKSVLEDLNNKRTSIDVSDIFLPSQRKSNRLLSSGQNWASLSQKRETIQKVRNLDWLIEVMLLTLQDDDTTEGMQSLKYVVTS